MSLLNKKAPNFKLISTSGEVIELNKIKSRSKWARKTPIMFYKYLFYVQYGLKVRWYL